MTSLKSIPFHLCWLWMYVMCCQCSPSTNNDFPTEEIVTRQATGDSLALLLTKEIETASGGLDNWKKVHFLSFDFFGSRFWYWDKYNDRYRVESEKRKFRIAGTLDGKETLLWLDGKVVTQTDSITKYKDLAHRTWINDTYWLILPFKLSDPGVHLTYLGPCIADSTIAATCFQMVFNNVGDTPNNKYKIYVDPSSHNIIYWDYFKSRTDTLPTLSNSWTDYRQYGDVKLSGGRGDRSLTDIKIFEKLPDRLFKDIHVPAREIFKG